MKVLDRRMEQPHGRRETDGPDWKYCDARGAFCEKLHEETQKHIDGKFRTIFKILIIILTSAVGSFFTVVTAAIVAVFKPVIKEVLREILTTGLHYYHIIIG